MTLRIFVRILRYSCMYYDDYCLVIDGAVNNSIDDVECTVINIDGAI